MQEEPILYFLNQSSPQQMSECVAYENDDGVLSLLL